jgi:hypothetical protein
VDQDWVFDAGMYNAVVLDVTGTGKDNYLVKYEGGLLTINKKAITKDMLVALIESQVKYYTGDTIPWAVGDFTIGNSLANVIVLKSVATTDYVKNRKRLFIPLPFYIFI